MSDFVSIELLPLGEVLQVPRGTPLQDVLFAHGVEFPCGGRGLCKGCKVKVLEGSLPIGPEERLRLSPAELAAGWRLACRGCAEVPLRVELAQWEAPILSDESAFPFTPQAGWGVAVDLGTTTLVAQLLDLQTGHVRAVATALNSQAQHGADIMSRVEYAVAGGGQALLEKLIREQIGGLIRQLLEQGHVTQPPIRRRGSHSSLAPAATPLRTAAPTLRPSEAPTVSRIVVVGNTVMHHLFCGISVEPLSRYPFEPSSPGAKAFSARDLAWDLPGNPQVLFLPCLGGFVGSDILAGILATKLHETKALAALVDLGTNGEIVIGNREQMLCASTAAGPAFEGARISMGMRAATGAISEVHLEDGRLHCHVLGDGAARGICGSGLVDAVAVGLDLGRLRPNGRLVQGDNLELLPPVSLTQWDIRELQLAKGAIAAGFRLLLEQWGAGMHDLTQVYLAGAFGNYINQASARRIGLLAFPPEKVKPAGNTALLGAKLALFGGLEHGGSYPEILRKVRHVALNEDPHFQETYVEEMSFPGAA